MKQARGDKKNKQIGKSLFADSFRGLHTAETVHGSICWQLRKVRSSAEELV
jgi:hypothetical protein